MTKNTLWKICPLFNEVGAAEFILERGFAGFPQTGKKCRLKFTLPRKIGRKKKKKPPKDKHYLYR